MVSNNTQRLATWDRLRCEPSRLFSSSIDQVEILYLPKGEKELRKLNYDQKEGREILNPEFVKMIDRSSAVFYILRQEFSWSPFKVSFATIKKVLDHHQVYNAFELVLLAFGFKIQEEDNIRSEHCFQMSGTSACPQTSHEISFNIRYPEKNGRSRGDPWSMRQTGIYHAFDHEAQRSVCILLQPPSYILEAITKDWKLNSMESSHALLLHLLSLLEWKWHSYLDYLWSCLRPFDEKASFWSASKSKNHGLEIEFSDQQMVHRLYGKFQSARSALESRVELLRDYRVFFSKVLSSDHELLPQLEFLLTRSCGYQRKMLSLAKRLDTISEMISRILDHQRQETIAAINKSVQDNLVTLRSISYQAQQDQSLVGRLALQAQTEFKSTRALTLIATMYLPASLLAQIFSSNLVQVNGSADGPHNGHFVLASQFWIFCIVTVVLMAITWGSKTLLERKL